MRQTRAINPDALDLAAGLARVVRCVVEAVFERGGTAVDDEDSLRPFALELETVGILALAQRRRRLRRVGQDGLHPFRDGPRKMLHCARFSHDD
jgi:hypothetical protein